MAEDFVDHRRIFRCQPTPSSGDDLQGTAAAAQKAADFILGKSASVESEN